MEHRQEHGLSDMLGEEQPGFVTHTDEYVTTLIGYARVSKADGSQAGLASARARGRSGGRPFKMTPAKLRLAQAAMGKPETKVSELCLELGVTRQTLYRHVTPDGQIRPDGEKLLGRKVARRSVPA